MFRDHSQTATDRDEMVEVLEMRLEFGVLPSILELVRRWIWLNKIVEALRRACRFDPFGCRMPWPRPRFPIIFRR